MVKDDVAAWLAATEQPALAEKPDARCSSCFALRDEGGHVHHGPGCVASDVLGMTDDGRRDVTCPRCAKVRSVPRYSVAGAWSGIRAPEYNPSVRDRALTCRTCKLLDTAERHRLAHEEAMAEVEERRAKGL